MTMAGIASTPRPMTSKRDRPTGGYQALMAGQFADRGRHDRVKRDGNGGESERDAASEVSGWRQRA
jgi:hypothetical protein